MQARIVYNGHEYASVEAMPDSVRREYEQVMAHLADSDGDGIPDVMKRGQSGDRDGAESTIRIAHSSISFDGRTFSSAGAMPAFVRRLLEESAAHARPDRHDASTPARLAAEEPPSPRRPLELFLGALLGVGAVVVLAGAAAMMATMDASSRSQGGRLYVALAALVALGALDTQAARLVARRSGSAGLFGTSAASRRFALLSMGFLVLSAALLFGLALLLP